MANGAPSIELPLLAARITVNTELGIAEQRPVPSHVRPSRQTVNDYQTQVIGAQDHLKGKMFRVGSMGTTSIDEMIEGCNRMIACFNEMGHALPNVDVASYFA